MPQQSLSEYLLIKVPQYLSLYQILIYINQLKTTKMAQTGYDPDRFVGTAHQPFNCIICLNVVLDPYQCHGCGKLFCKTCITDWSAKNTEVKCPNRCTINNIAPIFSKALHKMYNNLDIKCSNAKCNAVVKLSDLTTHQIKCMMIKCWNFQVCEKPFNKLIKSNKPCCSQVCSTVFLLKQKFGDKKAMYDILSSYSKEKENIPQPVNQTDLVWQTQANKIGVGIAITQNGTQCFLKEQSYLFRTALASTGFTSGVHYWQIVADNRTENQLKIGVSLNKDFDYNSAFCDHPFGFAYYGLGQLRQNSNASGPSYGKKFKKEGVLGVCLNMNTGVLAFSLNGEYMGVAFKDPKLTKGPIYPAVALLHCAGCKIKSSKTVPSYFKD